LLFDFLDASLVFEVLDNLFFVLIWAHERKNGRQEHEAVESSEDDDEEVHSEIVELEKRGRSECQHNDADELGGSDSNKHGTSHLTEGLDGSLLSRATLSHEVHANVVAELHAESNAGDEIDNEHCILLDRIASQNIIKHPHATHEFEKHEEYADRNVEGNLNAAEDLD